MIEKKNYQSKKKICEPTTPTRTPTQCIISSPTLQKTSHENDSNEISRRDLKYPSPYMHLYHGWGCHYFNIIWKKPTEESRASSTAFPIEKARIPTDGKPQLCSREAMPITYKKINEKVLQACHTISFPAKRQIDGRWDGCRQRTHPHPSLVVLASDD